MDFLEVFLKAIAKVPEVIQGTEALFGLKTGEQKKAVAMEMVGAAIGVANAVSAKHIADPEGFSAGLGQVIDGVVMCLKASVWAKS
jgi:hypothetical protein